MLSPQWRATSTSRLGGASWEGEGRWRAVSGRLRRLATRILGRLPPVREPQFPDTQGPYPLHQAATSEIGVLQKDTWWRCG
jgi:hypothetical protein